MSEHNWKPGDVAVTRAGGPSFRLLYVVGGRWINQCGSDQPLPADARPLVVIDPEDHEQVNRIPLMFGTLCRSDGRPISYGEWQNALCEYAEPTPPKPDQPTGRYAAVVDSDGCEWVRDRLGRWFWTSETGDHTVRGWDFIDAVRVLSEGVTQ